MPVNTTPATALAGATNPAPHRARAPRGGAWLWTLLLALVIPIAAGADDLPDIGDSAGALVSPEQERRVGEAFLREAYKYGVVIDDPEVEAYYQGLGQQLAEHVEGYHGSFTFFLVDSDVINAFAAPGGFIGMHSGLIVNTRNESELASVLAHEISHVTQRHAVRANEAMANMSLPMAAAMLGAILVGIANPGAAQGAIAAVGAVQQQYAINFTRANEQEADRIGIQLLERSGFDPQAMATFFERLQTANRYSDPKSFPEFLRTHPVTVNRIAEARERAEKIGEKTHADSPNYRLMRAKLRVLTARDTNRLLDEMETALREGQYDDETAARYGYALALTEAAQYGKARQQLTELARRDPDQPAFRLAIARLEQKSGNFVGALERYDETLRLYPGYKPAQLGHIEALLAARRGSQAREALREYAFIHTPDARYYTLLAEAEDQIGSQVESHIALAEKYFRQGETELALQQLELAQRQPQIDNYQRERVLARIDEIKKDTEDDEKSRRRRGG
ncbi:MAG: M48 family metalloprotease [Gammaproteobacteria bacterium]